MKNTITIACIPPRNRNDYLVDTVLDGLATLQENGDVIKVLLPDYVYLSKCNLPVVEHMPLERFVQAAKAADLILLFNVGLQVEESIAEEINAWEKTFFIDGSELGKNNRLDPEIIQGLIDGTYAEKGKVRFDLLKKCAGYFRREPPYVPGITPFPFGIERKYVQYKAGTKKDIDFVCIFGQEQYPPLRKEVRLALEAFCKEHGFSYKTAQTKLPIFNIHSPFAQWRFYKLLARSKVGVSVCGGGYDTLRFWEILGNNCMLLTETVGAYPPESTELHYDRIWQFSDLAEFKLKLETLGGYLRSEYDHTPIAEEYAAVLERHSTRARVLELLEAARQKGILK